MNSLAPRKFGIELEISRRFVNIAYSDRKKSAAWIELQEALGSLNYDGKISRGWRLKTDTSCGGELVSPPMFAPQGLQEVGHVAQMAKKIAKRFDKPVVDGECGLHLHFDASDMSPRHLSNLFVILHMAEPIIFAMYPARNFNYCAPIDVNMRLARRFRDWVDVRDTWYRPSNNVKDKRVTYSDSFISGTQPGDTYDGTRYHGFNIHCFWKLGTVEFRYGTGTFDLEHIRAYYEMCLSMMNTAMNSKRIKPLDGIVDKKYDELVAYYSTRYRGREYITKLCKLCGFSRHTIRLIMSLIRRNNPHFITKDPSKMPVNITDKNGKNFHFHDVDTGTFFNYKGELTNGPYGDKKEIKTSPTGRKYAGYTARPRVIKCQISDDYKVTIAEPRVSLSIEIKFKKGLKRHLSEIKKINRRSMGGGGSFYYQAAPIAEVALDDAVPQVGQALDWNNAQVVQAPQLLHNNDDIDHLIEEF
jgi:putative amidoligase enzyme